MKPSPEDMSMTTTTETLLPCPFCGVVPTRRDHVYRFGSIAQHPEDSYCVLAHTTIGLTAWNKRTPAPQPALDAGEWRVEPLPIHGWRIIDTASKEIVGNIYREEDAAQICADHRSAAAVPKLIQAAQNLLEYAAGLLLCLEARGVALGEGPQMQAAKTAIDEALTTVQGKEQG